MGNLISYKEKDGNGNLIGEFTPPTGSTMYSHINQLQGFDLKYGTYSVTYNFSYTKAGLIKEVSTGGKVFNFEYDESNNLISRTYANSTQDVYTYNEANQVVKTQTLDSGNQPKWSSKYTYDDDGRLTNITGTGPGSPTATYVYNDATVGEKLNRLTKATINDGSGDQTFNYRYDLAGNILAMDTPSGHRDFLYDADNRISQINGSASAVNYDSNGNLTKVTLNGVTYQYVYDSANRLIEVKDGAGANIASYTYDGDGRSLTKTVSGVTTTYHYFQGELLYETVNSDPAGVVRARYIRTPEGKLLGVRLYKPALQQYNYYYYHYNAHGDVVAVTDSNQIVYRQYVYDPYGNIISVKDENGNPVNINSDSNFNHAYTYAGYRYDQESGLYFLNARYYHAGIGRFLTKDSYVGQDKQPLSLNRYSYVGGDPVNRHDPSGNIWGLIVRAFVAAVLYFQTLSSSPDFQQDIQAIGEDLATSDYSGAALDTAAAAVPGVSAKAVRGAKKATEQAVQHARKFSPDQQALIDLAKNAKKIRRSVTSQEANNLLGWAKEYDLPSDGPEAHLNRPGIGRLPHVHIGPIDHLLIKD